MKFIGTKIVTAEAMTREAYNQLRGWIVPADENPTDDGYLVEYQDGGKPNMPGRAGYVSWSPKEQFENAYRPCAAMTFGLAIEALNKGYAITRAGWNGKDMFVYLVTPNAYNATSDVARAYFGGHQVPYNAYLAIKGADGRVSTWAPSVGDTVAEDWYMLGMDDLAAMRPNLEPDAIPGSQVDPSMGLPSKTAEQHAQRQALGQLGMVDKLQATLEAVSKHPTKDAEAKGDMPAPHVRAERIDALVASLQFKTLRVPDTTTTIAVALLPGMSNFVVSQGHSACVSPANFDAEKGVKYAIEAATLTAREKLWEFEGYMLATMLAGAGRNQVAPPSERDQALAQLALDGRAAHQVRVFAEKWDLDERLDKLRAFLVAPYFAHLDQAEQARLKRQVNIMAELSGVLAERIAAF